MNYKILYEGFKKKAVTLSYDDGTFYDVLLVEIINKYGLKCTFNINSGLFGAIANLDFGEKIIFHNRISLDQSKLLYKGHEIASHSLTHPLLTKQNKEFLDKEVLQDKINLKEILNKEIVGFAYPGGPYDENLNNYLKDKFLYARCVENTHSFELPKNYIPLKPTVFHLEPCFLDLCKQYLSYKNDEMSLFYIWGHSYEFALNDTMSNFIKMCKMFSKRNDIYFATNEEIITYLEASKQLVYDGKTFINNTDKDIYLEYKGKKIKVSANSQKQ
jgi:hypothetical protein